MKTGLIAAALSVAFAVTTIAGETVGFASRPMLAGKASLTEEGYVVRHDLGTARAIRRKSRMFSETSREFAIMPSTRLST